MPFVQANLIKTDGDDPEMVADWRDKLRRHGVWANDPVPLYPYPSSPDYRRLWGEPGHLFSETGDLISSEKVEGTAVMNRTGEKIGTIERLMIEKRSGKVAYDLIRKRDEKKAWDVAIVRVEQLYPFPHKAFAAELKKYPNVTDIVWCQDEPQNQGAWFFVQHQIHENMFEGQKLGYAGRPASASPACGYAHLHQDQQKALLDQAFAKLKGFVLTK